MYIKTKAKLAVGGEVGSYSTMIKASHVISNQSRHEPNSMNDTRPDRQPMTQRFPQVAEQAGRKSGGSQSIS